MKTLSLMLAIGLLFAACSDDKKTEKTPEPPALRLVGVKSALRSGSYVQEGCVSLGADLDRTVLVRFEVDNYRLKPPGACRGADACGSVKVTFTRGDETFSAATALTTAGIEFGNNPEGSYEVAVSLLDDAGKALVGESPCSGGACRSDSALRFVAYCDGDEPPVEKPDAAVPDGGSSSAVDGGPSAPQDAAGVVEADAG